MLGESNGFATCVDARFDYSHGMRNDAALTRSELVCVLIVILILGVFALPVRILPRKAALAQSCMNNLAQLGKASAQYMADTGGMFTSASTGGETWPRVMERKYIAGWNVFRSPFDRVTDSRPLAGNDGNARIPISYGINGYLFDRAPDEWADVKEDVIFAAPAVVKSPGSPIRWQDDAFADQNCRIFPGGSGSAFGTHLDRGFINVLFADFHVEQVKCEELSDDKSTKGKVRWTGAVERP